VISDTRVRTLDCYWLTDVRRKEGLLAPVLRVERSGFFVDRIPAITSILLTAHSTGSWILEAVVLLTTFNSAKKTARDGAYRGVDSRIRGAFGVGWCGCVLLYECVSMACIDEERGSGFRFHEDDQ
jgi:hypothetical protein